MSEKETPAKGKKAQLMLPVVAVAAFLLGFAAFGLVSKNTGSDGRPESVPSAEAVSDVQQQREEESAGNGIEGEGTEVLPAGDDASDELADAVKGSTLSQMDNDAAGTASPMDGADYIGEDAAKEAALTDAGVKESDTSYISCFIDYEDGRAEHYKVEFMIGNTEYEYEMDLYLGTVLEKSMDTINIHNYHNNHSHMEGSTYIGEEAAWEAALNHAGLKETEVTRKKVKLDEDDGVMVYEVEFVMGQMEYDYEIHAVSGEILKAEADKD